MAVNQEEPARFIFQAKRKPIVEEKEDQKNRLERQKRAIFDRVIDILKRSKDPMVGSVIANNKARESSYLLPDNIGNMSVFDQESEVRAIISVMPEHQ